VETAVKVYRTPDEVPVPEPDYRNYDFDREQARENQYLEDLRKWGEANGFVGGHNGKIAAWGQGDGYARYMFFTKGRETFLIHLALGDAWQLPYVNRLTKADVVQRIEQSENMKSIFAKRF
jgi:hypothetical protein